MRYLPILLLSVLGLAAMQQYTGPRPPKPDIPYLLHANNLIETEAAEAKEQPRKDDILYVIAGANSAARTPLASPVLLLQTDVRAWSLELSPGANTWLDPTNMGGTCIIPDVRRIDADFVLAQFP